MSENWHLQINISLSAPALSLIKERLEALTRQSPHGSLISLRCQKNAKESMLEGRLSVASSSRRFQAEAKARSLADMMDSLCSEVQKQLFHWKKSRTYEEITGVIHLHKLSRKGQSAAEDLPPAAEAA